MTENQAWPPVEGNLTDILKKYPQPLMALAAGEMPAILLRQAYNSNHCMELIQRFYERGLMYDPHKTGDGSPHRVDIGTSLGRYNSDREEFFAHSAGTHELFNTLFDGYDDPVKTMYEALSQLAPNKNVMAARETDGSVLRSSHLPYLPRRVGTRTPTTIPSPSDRSCSIMPFPDFNINSLVCSASKTLATRVRAVNLFSTTAPGRMPCRRHARKTPSGNMSQNTASPAHKSS